MGTLWSVTNRMEFSTTGRFSFFTLSNDLTEEPLHYNASEPLPAWLGHNLRKVNTPYGQMYVNNWPWHPFCLLNILFQKHVIELELSHIFTFSCHNSLHSITGLWPIQPWEHFWVWARRSCMQWVCQFIWQIVSGIRARDLLRILNSIKSCACNNMANVWGRSTCGGQGQTAIYSSSGLLIYPVPFPLAIMLASSTEWHVEHWSTDTQ